MCGKQKQCAACVLPAGPGVAPICKLDPAAQQVVTGHKFKLLHSCDAGQAVQHTAHNIPRTNGLLLCTGGCDVIVHRSVLKCRPDQPASLIACRRRQTVGKAVLCSFVPCCVSMLPSRKRRNLSLSLNPSRLVDLL